MTNNRSYKIGVIAGDGIGQEVIPAGIERCISSCGSTVSRSIPYNG